VVREATKLLESKGLVEIRRGIGVVVVEPSPDVLSHHLLMFLGNDEAALWDLHQVREVIEPEIAALAAENATREDIAKLEQVVLQMKEGLASRAEEEYVAVDLAFHRGLAQSTQNTLLQLLVHSIVDTIHEIGQPLLSAKGAEGCVTHHGRILKAVKSGKPKEASKAMRRHLKQIRRDLRLPIGLRETEG